ncbi:MAG TPA: Asp-tRNA(Asn)/Glu-tRNA(Gln) amidotransferase subunit GatA [bacterium]|nr:Asp-tRNA(Asn)/Glu-tRNA(Gln) amidotransferase subunit GatA [bacterium]
MDRPAGALLADLRARVLAPSELMRACLDRIAALEPTLHAFLALDPDRAMAQARAWDERYARGEMVPPLAGLPVAVKDNLCTTDFPTTCGSRILEGWISPYDATAVTRLRQAGAIVVGKTNLDEFAMGSSTENSAFGPTRNPWDPSRVPGGSSGGSAAAVAAGCVPLALGSDTGGSIRQPAGFCGIVGVKPTYGRVSRYGLVAFASSLDQIGPLARTVADAALLLEVVAGCDPADATSVDTPVPPYRQALEEGVRGLRVGVVREAFGDGLAPEVRDAVQTAARVLAEAGAALTDVSLPTIPYALPTYYLLATSEASANLARYDGVRYGLRVPSRDLRTMYTATRRAGFGAEVKRRIMLGTYALSAGYYEGFFLKAQQVRTLIRRDFEAAFARADLLLLPTSPTVPFPLGERVDDPLQMYLADVYTIPVNLAGLPAISIPCGLPGGLPVGLQLIGRPFEEPVVLRAAHAYEQATPWHARRPPIGAAPGRGGRA